MSQPSRASSSRTAKGRTKRCVQTIIPEVPLPAPGEPPVPFPLDSEVIFTPGSLSAGLLDRFSSTYEVLPALYPCWETWNQIPELEDIEATLVRCNLGFLCRPDPGTYKRLVLEFLPSFSAEWMGEPNDRYRCVLSWRFRLGGIMHTLSREDFDRIMNCRANPYHPAYGRQTRDTFWSLITEKEGDYVSGMPSSMIAAPRWKVLHRLIAENLFAREDRGRVVNNKDLDAMILIHENRAMDVMNALSRQWREYQLDSCKAKAIGGGMVISLIARHLGYALDPKPSFLPRTLDEETMELMRMRKGQQWVVRTDMPERARKRIRTKMRHQGRGSPTPPPPADTHDIPAAETARSDTADYARLTARIDALALVQQQNTNRLESVAHSQQQFMAWSGEAMRIMYQHLGISNLFPTPPVSAPYQPSSSQHAPSGSGPGDAEMGDVPTDDDDLT